jgi:hypothetical protein
MGKKTNLSKFFIGKRESKRPFGRRGRRKEDNIKTVRKKMGWGDME